MRILYIHQYFHTPLEPGSTRSYWISRELIKNGHQVIVITSNPKITHNKEVKEIDGIKVIYLKTAYNQSMSISQRLIAFIGFVWKSTAIAIKQKNIDIVFATSTPLTIGIPALLLKWFKHIPYIFEVRDLWPEVPIQMGAIKNKLIIKISRFFEKTIYKNASHVIALSPGMQDGVIKYISKKHTSMIPNMAKIDEFGERRKNIKIVEKHKLKPNSFKVIHFGSLGLANGAETIIDSARILKEDPTIDFLFVGGGSTENKLKEDSIKYNLTNVFFLGKFPMKETSEIVNISDVSIISFKDLPILYTNSPNKFFDSLSAGKPIIVNSAGWTKDIVEQHNCGYYVNPNNPQELVGKIKYLQTNPQIAAEMGVNSRKLAETEYDKSILLKKIVAVFNDIYKKD